MSADPNHAFKHRLVVCGRAIGTGYRHANTLGFRVFRVLCKLLLLAYFIFCALFLTLRYVVLPHIDEYKGTIERVASSAIGNPVTIATVGASWDGFRPRLSLKDVVIHDRSGASALTLPEVSASISWQTVLVGDLRFHTLTITQPDLSILRDTDGRLFVAGIPIAETSKNNNAMAWVLSQREIVIRKGRIRWEDRQRMPSPAELRLDDVDLVLRNNWLRHRLALKAVPPATLAAPLDVRADFMHSVFASDIADIRQWSGVLYADLRNTDLALWKSYVDFPFALERGTGSVRAWLTLDRSRVADFTADLRLSDVSAQLGRGLQPLQLAAVSGRVVGTEPTAILAENKPGTPTFGANGHSVSLQDFSLRTSDGLDLPPTTISETFTPAQRNQSEKFSISAQLLDLQILGDLAGRLPLTGPQRQLLSDLSPRGRLQSFSAQWQGTYPEIETYRLKGAFQGLGLRGQPPHLARPKTATSPAQAAVPGIPGFDNLSGQVDLTEKGGNLRLASQQLTFQLPGYFADPALPFDQLDLQASWSFEKQDTLALRIDHMDFARPGLVGSIAGSHLWPMRGDRPGIADLHGKLVEFDINTIGQYLPLQTPEQLQHWLTGALLEGKVTDADLRLQGDLSHFPFEKAGTGQFNVSGKFDGLKMNYTPVHSAIEGKPEWPLLEQGKGTIVFDRGALAIHADSARTNGVGLSDVSATVSDLYNQKALLAITGNAAGPMQDMVAYVNNSHVSDWIDHFTEETAATGDGRLQLKLELPLNHIIDAKVNGTLQFLNNDVVLQNIIPAISRANGKLSFDETGFSLSNLKGQFLGEAVTVGGGTQPDKSTLVNIEGGVSADGLRRAYPMPEVKPVLDRIAGSTRFKSAVQIKNHALKITVDSNLQGIGMTLPAPLIKDSAEPLPLRFEMTALASDQPGIARDELKLSAGELLDARYLRERSTARHALSRIVSGGIGINRPAAMPDSGLLMAINAKSLNLDDWSRLINNVSDISARTPAPASAPHGGLIDYIQPNAISARTDELQALGRKLDHVVFGATRSGNAWQLNLDSSQASGYITWSEAQAGHALGKVTARLAKLSIQESTASGVGELLGSEDAGTQIPALDISADDFHLFGKSLGRLELQADNVPAGAGAGAGREWRIGKLSLANPDAQLKASGNWIAKGKDNTSHLTYALDIHNAGKLLDRFGFTGTMRGGAGQLDGDVTWAGLPFALDVPSLSGQVHLDLASGQFLKVDPGAAKLLGVLNLQALPRRLTLDFRDVFSEGFAFDRLFGSADIAKGIASTDNLKMTSVAATVLMSGSADVERETQKLHVVVIPEVNLGTASLVALAINPVVGVGTFLAQLFLRDPLMRQLTFEYNIDGSWADPQVTKLAKRNLEDNKGND
ncbi:TIGR02099 family protein [Oxalobacteraceae bacterium CAVE-383]|nr:TIGR02099 family protein [Oxalobacteraceae bacterium CAVE-383]